MSQTRREQMVLARSTGVTERDCELISGAFVYPGFRMKAGT